MALCGNDAQTAQRLDLFVVFLPLGPYDINLRFLLVDAQRFVALHRLKRLGDIATQHNIGSPARHIGGDGDHLGPARLGNNVRFTRMLLGIQNLMRQLLLL